MEIFETKFGMFVPCSYELYKKIKKISFYYHNYAIHFANRWQKSQKRLLHNRYFKKNKIKIMVKDSWLCPTLFTQNAKINLENRLNELNLIPYKDQTDIQRYERYSIMSKLDTKSYTVDETELCQNFLKDWRNCKTPKKTREEVIPMILSEREINKLLETIENWHLTK